MRYSRHRLTASVAYVRVNQWLVDSLCLPIGHFVKNQTVSFQFSLVTSLCTRLKEYHAIGLPQSTTLYLRKRVPFGLQQKTVNNSILTQFVIVKGDLDLNSFRVQLDTLGHTLTPSMSAKSCHFCFFSWTPSFVDLRWLCFSSLFVVDLIGCVSSLCKVSKNCCKWKKPGRVYFHLHSKRI